MWLGLRPRSSVADAVRAVRSRASARRGRAVGGFQKFAKDVMAAAGVPTAESVYCTTVDEVAEAIDRFGRRTSQDGLRRKGVIVTSDRDAALAHAEVLCPRLSRSTWTAPRCHSSRSPTVGPRHCSQPRIKRVVAYRPTPEGWCVHAVALARGLVDAIGAGGRPTIAEMAHRETPSPVCCTPGWYTSGA